MKRKIDKKAFCFGDNSIWIGCVKLSLLRREYLSSAVNVLTVIRFCISLKETFSNSFTFKMITKYGNGAKDDNGAWLFHKNVPHLIFYQWTKFQCHTLFLSQDIKQNVLLSSYLDSWWHHKF